MLLPKFINNIENDRFPFWYQIKKYTINWKIEIILPKKYYFRETIFIRATKNIFIPIKKVSLI